METTERKKAFALDSAQRLVFKHLRFVRNMPEGFFKAKKKKKKSHQLLRKRNIYMLGGVISELIIVLK